MGVTEADYDSMVKDIRAEFQDFKIVKKSDSRFMSVVDFLLKVITAWRNTSFMTAVTTTIGYTVYVSDNWLQKAPDERVGTLRHERVHMRQRRERGAFVFGFLYLFAWFPIGLAKWRRDFEMEAYEETMRAVVEQRGYQFILKKDFREHIVNQFLSANYFWAWHSRKDVETWYNDACVRIYEEHIK